MNKELIEILLILSKSSIEDYEKCHIVYDLKGVIFNEDTSRCVGVECGNCPLDPVEDRKYSYIIPILNITPMG